MFDGRLDCLRDREANDVHALSYGMWRAIAVALILIRLSISRR